MPAPLTYPGVYVEEIPSGVHTIIGVATSITAFVGRTRSGTVDDPTPVFTFDEFARRFGGLWSESPMTYAVRDFFLNGGGQALIVRLAGGADTAALDAGGLALVAISPGSWGADLRAAVDHLDPDASLAASLGLDPSKLFNLTVTLARPGGQQERFHNLSVEDNARNVAAVLERDSRLVRVAADWQKADPTDGQDELGELEQAVDKARHDYQTGAAPDKQALKDAENVLRAAIDVARAKVGDGATLKADDFIADARAAAHEGLFALDKADLFNLLCLPPHRLDAGDLEPGLISAAMAYCEKRRAVLLVDPRDDWDDPADGLQWLDELDGPKANAVAYFPRLRQPDPERGDSIRAFAPCGAVAGVMARTDASRGVWKAPAGLDATLTGVRELAVRLTDDENGLLNPLGINCLRSFPLVGRVVWGARTLVGADALASEWKYLPIRRLALFIEESLFRGTKWVVFEPNDEPLWAQIRLNVGSFMHELFRQGAFQGRTPRDAYFVRCDADTTTQADRDRGIVNILVGFAPLKPAEFVVLRLQQIAGNLEV
jgi:phage tail sheath protein FI